MVQYDIKGQPPFFIWRIIDVSRMFDGTCDVVWVDANIDPLNFLEGGGGGGRVQLVSSYDSIVKL